MTEIADLTNFFFVAELDYDASRLIGKQMEREQAINALTVSRERLEPLVEFDAASLEALLRPLAGELRFKTGQLFGTLRTAVSGRTVSPPLFEMMAVLGKERCFERIGSALKKLAA